MILFVSRDIISNPQCCYILLLLVMICSAKNPLPDGPLIIGYADWGQCDEKLVEAAQNGVNIIIWFSIDMVKDNLTGNPTIQRGPDFNCVAQIAKSLKVMNLPTLHLISIGGWNSPHIDTSFSAEEWWNVWLEWNTNTVAKPEIGFHGFDGLDWDLEGNDDLTSPWNHFTVEVLDLVGRLSQLAKKNGFIVGIAPSQSYFDVGSSLFDRSLLHIPSWKPGFSYHGLNTYAPIIAKYGKIIIDDFSDPSLPISTEILTFDFLSLQLYEGWSRSNHEINDNHQPISTYLVNLVQTMLAGWTVDFSNDPEIGIPSQLVKIQKSQLVIGLANGWAGPRPNKFLLLWPEELKKAYEGLLALDIEPKGFMFWNVKDEGTMVDGKSLVIARGLNEFLNVRQSVKRNPHALISLG